MLKYAFLMLGLVACSSGDKGGGDDGTGEVIEHTDDSGTTDTGDGGGGDDLTDADNDGFYAEQDDCNDDNPAIHPEADEVCDGVDNDCDELVDDEDTDVTDAGTYYVDADSDGYGAELITACEMPENAVERAGDCNDADPEIHPEADELCDGVDNDCDDEIDNDALDANTYYIDADGDGYGESSESIQSCELPEDASLTSDDCDDSDADVNPGERETVVDGVDTDCDGSLPDAESTDTDGDGTDDWYDDIVIEMNCNNIAAYQDTVDFSGESHWYAATLASTLPACYQLEEDTETMLLVEDSVPDQDVWTAFVSGGYLNAVDEDDTEVTYWGMVFGYIDENNYSVVYYSEEDEVFGFEQWVSGSLNEYETTSASGLTAIYLASIEVTVYEYAGTPRLEASITDLVTGTGSPFATLDFELDSFWGNLEGQFGAYSEGGTSYVTSSETYPEYSSYLVGGGAP